MATKYCINCQRLVEANRHIGVGTVIMLLITGLFWIFFIPFYSKRCSICGGTNFTEGPFIDKEQEKLTKKSYNFDQSSKSEQLKENESQKEVKTNVYKLEQLESQKKSHKKESLIFLIVFIISILISIVIDTKDEPKNTIAIIFIVISILSFFLLIYHFFKIVSLNNALYEIEAEFKLHKKQEEKEKEQEKLITGILKNTKNIINKYIEKLASEALCVIEEDNYGNKNYEKYYEKLNYFYENVILRDLEDSWRINSDLEFKEECFKYINSRLEIIKSIRNNFSETMTGEEYESFCASILEDNGWMVEKTKSSYDQGVDLIAIKNNFKVVIQCKKYSSSVGNAAVQEVIAGKNHYFGKLAIVVTNSTYSSSAIGLAKSNNVKLLHHNDLYKLDDYIFS